MRAMARDKPADQKKEMQKQLRRDFQEFDFEVFERRSVRALYSPHQLQETLTWFWFNHFNVFQNKKQVRFLLSDYEEGAIRPHVLGKFRDLLQAVLMHPAMLVYLDNAENRAFVSAFEKEYGRLPSGYAAQGYDAARAIDAAVREVKGKLDDSEALRKAFRANTFKSVRGPFKINHNGFPIQNYYLRVVERDAKGRITNRTLSTVLKDHPDAYAGECPLK